MQKVLETQSPLTNSMNHHQQGAYSKRPAVSPVQPMRAKTCLSSGKTAGALAPGAYTEYVRANGAKSAKSVSAKPDKDPRTPLADFFNRLRRYLIPWAVSICWNSLFPRGIRDVKMR